MSPGHVDFCGSIVDRIEGMRQVAIIISGLYIDRKSNLMVVDGFVSLKGTFLRLS